MFRNSVLCNYNSGAGGKHHGSKCCWIKKQIEPFCIHPLTSI